MHKCDCHVKMDRTSYHVKLQYVCSSCDTDHVAGVKDLLDDFSKTIDDQIKQVEDIPDDVRHVFTL